MTLHAHVSHSEKFVFIRNQVVPKGTGLFRHIDNPNTGDRYYFHKDSEISDELNKNIENFVFTLFIYTVNLPKLIYGAEFGDWHTWGVKFVFMEEIHIDKDIEFLPRNLEDFSSNDLEIYLQENSKSQPVLVQNTLGSQYVEIMIKTGPCICPKIPSFQNMLKVNGSNLTLLSGLPFSNNYNLVGCDVGESLWAYPLLGYVDNEENNCPQQKGELIDFLLFLNETDKIELSDRYPNGKDPRDFSAKISHMPRFSEELYCFYYTRQDLIWWPED